MAISYVDEVTRKQPEGPYVLAGYCMGGKVALEMAHVLRERGHFIAMVALLDSFNLNVENADYFRMSKLSYLGQVVMFHTSNMFAHGRRDSWLYFREKARQAQETAVGWLRSTFKNVHFLGRDRAVDRDAPVEEFIQSVNDRPGFAYLPRVYSGTVTQFKPRRHYSGFNDPKMGWGDTVKGGLEIVELNMNPHAMLVEPFVQELAAKINVRLQRLFTVARPSTTRR